MRIKIIFIAFILTLSLSAEVFANWTFKNGTFTMNGDSSFFITPSSSLYIQDFGYYLNNDRRIFHTVTLNDMNKALNFKDGDKVTFAKRGLFFNYYAVESNPNLYTISSRGSAGITIPFTFSLTANPSVKPSGQPLPSVLITILLGLVGSSYFFVKKRKRA